MFETYTMYMKLVLKNFRIFIEAEFEFDSSLTLISGKSGRGKSTICMAISFVLTGQGKKLIHYNKTSCSATLEIRGFSPHKIVVTRSKHPNRLKVFSSEMEENFFLEDKEAQAFIDRVFDQYNTGYVSQRVDKIFLALPSMEKLTFIEKIAFGSSGKPDQINKICKALIKDREIKLNEIINRKQGIQSTLCDMNVSRPNTDIFSMLANFIDNKKSSQGLQIELAQNQQKLNEYKLLLDREREQFKRRNDLTDRLNQINTKISENLSEFLEHSGEAYVTLLKGEHSSSSQLKIIDAELGRMSKERQAWECYQQACFERDKANKKYLLLLSSAHCVNITKISTEINDLKCIIAIMESLSLLPRYETELSEVNRQIENAKMKLTCPHCKTDVLLWGNDLLLINNTTKNYKTDTNLSVSEVKQLEARQLQLQKKIARCASEIGLLHQKWESNDYVNIFGSATTVYKEECLKAVKGRLVILEQLLTFNIEFEAKQQMCNVLKIETPPAYTFQIEELLKTRRNLLYEKKAVSKQLKTLPENQDSLLEQTILEAEKEMKKLDIDIKNIAACEHWVKVDALAVEEEEFQQSLPRATKLYEIVKTAATKSIQQIVDEINIVAQIYLDQFLDDVVVELKCDHDKIVVDVTQAGNQTDLNSLSGGEYARVVIAFTVAIAEINNVRLLIIDESTASLDQETTNKVIQTIKDNFKGLIIFVAHQTTTGVFDKVIDLDRCI